MKKTKRGKNPNSIANLKPIKKGEVRNPSGKNGSERRCLWEASFLRYFTQDDIDMEDPNATLAIGGDKAALKECGRTSRINNVWRALYRQANAGSVPAQLFILERAQGAPSSEEAAAISGAARRYRCRRSRGDQPKN